MISGHTITSGSSIQDGKLELGGVGEEETACTRSHKWQRNTVTKPVFLTTTHYSLKILAVAGRKYLLHNKCSIHIGRRNKRVSSLVEK